MADLIWNKLVPKEGCREWPGAKSPKGYGCVKFQGKSWRAHRLCFYLFYGWVPDLIRHTCNNPACCNPLHLVPGTHQDNSDDKLRAGRQAFVRGQKHGRSKLSELQVQQIRRAQGTQKQIADRFGISQPHVSAIRRGVVWQT